MADESAILRHDQAYTAHMVRHSRSRRGKLLSGDKYFNPQTLGNNWVDAGNRLYTLGGAQVSPTSLDWSDLFDRSSTWTIELTVSAYIAGTFTVGNSDDVSGALSGNGQKTITLDIDSDFDLLLTASSTFNGDILIGRIRRQS